jgi:osmotically-inducible protein OsmY
MRTDAELKQYVIDELNWEPTVVEGVITPSANPQIGVTVTDGVVTLDGEVDSYSKKWSAYRAAGRVGGVNEVVDNIKVKLPGSFKLAGEEIGRAAVQAIALNADVPQKRVNVRVQDGSITLSGEVDGAHQREAAEEAVRHIKGVVWVSDQITLKPPVEPVDTKIKIESAFRRNALLDSRRIGVETHGDKVILKGSVQSWAEREEAQRVAWAAPGITQVENHILIIPWSQN